MPDISFVPMQDYDSLPASIGWLGEKQLDDQETPLEFLKFFPAEVEECYSEISRQMQMLSLIEERIVKLSSPALGLLNLLSLLSPNEVVESILNQKLPSDGVLQYPVTSEMYIQARDELVQSSLARWKWNGMECQLVIQKDVQDANQCSITTEEYHDSFDTAVLLLCTAFPKPADEASRFDIKDEDVEKIEKLLPLIFTLHQSLSETQLWHPSFHIKREFVWLLQRTGWYLVQEAEDTTAKQFLDLALAISEDHYFEMLDLQSDILFCLARCGAETKMSPSLIVKYSAEHLDLCQELDDGTLTRQRDISNAHTNLAEAYLLLEDYPAALLECRKSKEILRATEPIINGNEFPEFVSIYEGWALLGLERQEEAAEKLMSVVHFREQKNGIDEPPSLEMAFAQQALGNVRSAQNRHQESLIAYKKARVNFRAILGDNNFRTGQVCLKLAEHYAQASQAEIKQYLYVQHSRSRETARRYFTRALTAFRSSPHQKAELSRAIFKLWQFERDLLPSQISPSLPSSPRDAARYKTKDLYDRAKELYREVVGKERYNGVRQLGERDFEGVVRFWSR